MIIKSLLDLDLYKLTMQQAVIRHFPRTHARYQFFNRGKTSFPPGFADRLRSEINNLAQLYLFPAERQFLQNTCYYFTPPYIDFLNGYRFNPEEVYVEQQGGELSIEIKGFWYRTILWETILMSMVSELYFDLTEQRITIPIERINETKAKVFQREGIKYADFGTRRRYSFLNHDRVLGHLLQYGKRALTGTSNVYLAMKHHITPIGTMAHEWISGNAALHGFRMAHRMALEAWTETYQGSLGIALPDTFTTDAFYRDFEPRYAKLFDGVRQDSGDPIKFAEKTIEHYENLGIDPRSKTIVFSDSLNTDRVLMIHKFCSGKIRDSYGIGTFLTNDIPGIKPLNIVIKLVELDGIPAVKLSDDPGKHTGDPDVIKQAEKEFEV